MTTDEEHHLIGYRHQTIQFISGSIAAAVVGVALIAGPVSCVRNTQQQFTQRVEAACGNGGQSSAACTIAICSDAGERNLSGSCTLAVARLTSVRP